MKYNELKESVAANITNQEALVGLMTSENIELVATCAPGLASVSEPYQQADGLGTYEAGDLVATRMYDDKSSPSTVDEVLAEFTPGNAYAAQQYVRLNELLLSGGTTPEDYFEALETESNESDTLLC